ITAQSALADAQAQMQTDALQERSMTSMHKSGLVSDVDYTRAVIQAKKSADDMASRQAQVAVAQADAQAKIAAAQAQVTQAAATLTEAEAQVGALTVRSATSGIVQTVDVDPGMSVAQSTVIAHIADMHDLKAVLQVAESDVHSVTPGMLTHIDTGNGV